MSEAALEKPESWLWHLLGFVLPSIALAGNVLGEWWVLSGVVLAFGIYPILDWLLGEAPAVVEALDGPADSRMIIPRLP
jgi:hypothetical protein